VVVTLILGGASLDLALYPQWRGTARAFIDHVKRTGDPNSFPGIVTSRPPADAEIVWLTEIITVPVQKRPDRTMIPCPWCSPSRPKFKKGRLCLFPAEGAIRFIGWECAKSHIDAERLATANRRWKEDRRRELRDAWLRANCHRAPEYMQLAEDLQLAAAACDAFHHSFRKDSSDIHADLARTVRRGELVVYGTPDPALGGDRASFSRRFGLLQGTAVLRANPHLKDKLRAVVASLGTVTQDARRAIGGGLTHMNESRRDALEIKLREAHKDLVKVITTILEFQAFLHESNIELLNVWCQHPGSEISESGIEVLRRGTRLNFAYRAYGNRCTTRIDFDAVVLAPVKMLAAFEDGSVGDA
jgi:hypothetical protein